MHDSAFDEQRTFFPALQDWVYLDHPSAGLFPSYAHEVMTRYIDRGIYHGMPFDEFAEDWVSVDRSRDDIARMINCSGADIAFGLSSTALFNIFVNGMDLQPGENVITSSASHESVPYILLNKRQDGIEIRFVDPVDGATAPESVFALADENTRAICLNHVEKLNGFRHGLKIYGEYCRKKGILFGVDASHGAGVMEIDVRDMHIDFLTTSGYKWLMSPLGVGFAYISEDLRKSLKLVDSGWSGSLERWNKDVRNPVLSEDARRFECGCPCILAIQALTEVVRRYNALGARNIQERSLALVDYFYERIEYDFAEITINGAIPPPTARTWSPSACRNALR